MFTVTRAAAKQIRRSASSSDTEELALRIAASRTGDGGIESTAWGSTTWASTTPCSAPTGSTW